MFSTRSNKPNHILKAVESDTMREGIAVSLDGRLMLPTEEEFECTVPVMTADVATFVSNVRPRNGTRVIAYLAHIGRIEGTVSALTADGFLLSINATERKKDKLTAQLEWIAKRQALGLPEGRRHDRLTPRKAIAELMLSDGHVVPCKFIDLSLSGAAVEIDPRPAMGSVVRLGSMNGKIVRHFVEGVAIEFDHVQSRDALMEFL
jgi:hypothetical protein